MLKESFFLFAYMYNMIVCLRVHIQVVNTAPPVQTVVLESGPPNYIVLNVIALLFCCFFFGLVGLFYSLRVMCDYSITTCRAVYCYSNCAFKYVIFFKLCILMS